MLVKSRKHLAYATAPAIVLALAACLADAAKNQKVVQSRGVDQTVDYEALKSFGPWDDRNYSLTSDDLKLLAPNEKELRDPIPAFFRVLLRKKNPRLPREGAAQYPRSALQVFLRECKGYLINGKVYTQVKVEAGRYIVVEESGVDYRKPKPSDPKGQGASLDSDCGGL